MNIEKETESVSEEATLAASAREFMKCSIGAKYSYHFHWLSRPIIQYPQDIIAMQELIWRVKPDLIIETGIAHGGSLIFSASMLMLLDGCEALEKGKPCNPAESRRGVIGIDIDIRRENRAAIEAHPLASYITMVEGSSTDAKVIAQVQSLAKAHERILVCLDSNHTHDHVLAELEAYAPLVSAGSYCVVFDTVIEDLPEGTFPDRAWGKGNSPRTAVEEYLRRTKNIFVVDRDIEKRLLITVAPGGYLRRT